MNELITVETMDLNPYDYVMTLKDITDLIEVQHSKAMLKVEKLALEPSFGSLSKMDIQYLSGKNTYMPLTTYALNKKQAIACGALLNTALLMKVIDRLEELEKNMTELEKAKRYVRQLEQLEASREQVKYLEITLDKTQEWSSIKKQEHEQKKSFKWQPLKKYSVDNGIEIESVFDQNYGTVNSYHKDVWLAVYGIEI